VVEATAANAAAGEAARTATAAAGEAARTATAVRQALNARDDLDARYNAADALMMLRYGSSTAAQTREPAQEAPDQEMHQRESDSECKDVCKSDVDEDQKMP
jgi:hypothetical protein